MKNAFDFLNLDVQFADDQVFQHKRPLQASHCSGFHDPYGYSGASPFTQSHFCGDKGDGCRGNDVGGAVAV